MVRIEDLTDNDVAYICERAVQFIIEDVGFVLIEPNDYDEYEVPDSVERLFIGEDFELDIDSDFQPSDSEWEIIFKDIKGKHEEFCEDAADEILASDIFWETISNAKKANEFEASFEVLTPFLVYDLDIQVEPSSYDWKVIIEHMKRSLEDEFVGFSSYSIDFESGDMKIHLTL